VRPLIRGGGEENVKARIVVFVLTAVLATIAVAVASLVS
jgi:hypothetical protein